MCHHPVSSKDHTGIAKDRQRVIQSAQPMLILENSQWSQM